MIFDKINTKYYKQNLVMNIRLIYIMMEKLMMCDFGKFFVEFGPLQNSARERARGREGRFFFRGREGE